MKRKRLSLKWSVACSISLAILIASQVYAAHGGCSRVPDSGPFLDRVDIYRHLRETDDMLIVARYNVPYATSPMLTIEQAWIGRFMDGSSELARVSPYPYYNSDGYNYGAFSMYFDAASAPTWEGSYTADLSGSPTLEWLGLTATTAMTGAVADDGGAQTDETTEANSAAANDMTLLSAGPAAVDDAYYFGDGCTFDLLTLNIGTAGAGTWTITWEYYDGSTWSALSGVTDGTDNFRAAAGNHDVTYTVPDAWTETTVSSITAYWIRGRVSAYTSKTVDPLGTQSWTNANAATPTVSTSTLSWWGSTTTSASRAVLYGHLIAYAKSLSTLWSLAMTTTSPSGEVLSAAYGIPYFTNAIPELRSMCPQLFAEQVTSPQYEDKEWQKTQAEEVTSAWPFDWGGMSEWLGMPSDDEVFRTLIAFVIVFILGAFLMARTNRTDFTLVACFGLLIVAAVPGWISPVIVGGFTFATAVVAGLIFVVR